MEIINKKFYIWGTGIRANELNMAYGMQIKEMNIAGYIDNDPTKTGSDFYGKKIYSPEILNYDQSSYIVIVNDYKAEIKKQIDRQYPWYADRIVSEQIIINFLILSRYANTNDKEIKEILLYLKDHVVSMFNYPFVERYKMDSDIKFDDQKGLYYIWCLGKKMYLKRSFSEKYAKFYYSCIQLEQDQMSPHRYLTEKFNIPDNAVVIDAGAAEGYFALLCIEKVKKIYLFEPDAEWVEALEYTFMPYRDKVVIINKYLSDNENDYSVTIDKSVQENEIDFIKMDIEGDEYYALLGAVNTKNSSSNMQCAICTYHQEFAFPLIKNLLEGMDFYTEPSHGYVCFNNDRSMARVAVLRRCLIRGRKNFIK